jgi:hypothetical protein
MPAAKVVLAESETICCLVCIQSEPWDNPRFFRGRHGTQSDYFQGGFTGRRP